MKVYLTIFDNNTICAEAYAEEPVHIVGDHFKRQLLFEIESKWLPQTKEQFLAACVYFKKEVPTKTIWFGYVPF